ncbi:MAG: hypothetical protein MZU91_11005 [Desulfosudis oleivorans]|nr:hypothetical protein [Desulfosudis oleivorans]
MRFDELGPGRLEVPGFDQPEDPEMVPVRFLEGRRVRERGEVGLAMIDGDLGDELAQRVVERRAEPQQRQIRSWMRRFCSR